MHGARPGNRLPPHALTPRGPQPKTCFPQSMRNPVGRDPRQHACRGLCRQCNRPAAVGL